MHLKTMFFSISQHCFCFKPSRFQSIQKYNHSFADRTECSHKMLRICFVVFGMFIKVKNRGINRFYKRRENYDLKVRL